MQFMFILLQLAGAIMLLLWAVRMVRTGVERAHGAVLREALRGATRERVRAATAGTVLAVMLQSATAVAVLASGFAATGVMTVSGGLAVMLGADVGSALVVQALSFDLSWLVPLLLFAGATLFLKVEARIVKQTGRTLLGIAFILISLRMVGEATAPMRHSALLPMAVDYLRSDPVTAFGAAALFTWLVHSSVASVLLFMSMAAQGVLPAEVALPMILGVNLGAGLVAVGLTRGQAIDARRIPVGNLIFRATAAVAILVALQLVELPMAWFGESAARQVVNMHLAFNLALLVLCLPFTGPMERLVRLILPDAPAGQESFDLMSRRTSALDRTVIKMPSVALACATREVLRMAEVVEIMLRPVMDLFESGDRARVDQVRKLDDEVNRAHTDIKLYIAEVNRGTMTQEEARRGIELTDLAINLEHAGDIIAKNLLVLAEEKSDKRLSFSREGWSELTALHDRVLANMQIAMNVLVSGDLEAARQLVVEKERMRRLERDSHERHLKRLQSGTPQSIETSDIHLEAVRALKEFNSLLVSVAYPILTQSGDLLESRLARTA
ncbi:Na/Pi cotransporter family protein [Aminobacter niigataensis]|uniref:Na/Pi cotransporter family protein n=1 Tax=Aminobacter niigataensis TaxID=83265 RepID=UPI00228337C4|nr:Na/Pi cotransporter family protein [Aminobacter niigataensis]CAI2936693.1 Sodium-dependent inorganic phosphate (Pi) transporter [Aminobacter niigataensis]